MFSNGPIHILNNRHVSFTGQQKVRDVICLGKFEITEHGDGPFDVPNVLVTLSPVEELLSEALELFYKSRNVSLGIAPPNAQIFSASITRAVVELFRHVKIYIYV